MAAPANNQTIAKAIQDCAVALLQSGAEFSGVPILGRRRLNIVDEIEAAIAQLGACIWVLPGLPRAFSATMPPWAERYELRVRVIENPALNTTQPDVYELTELVVRRFYGVQFTTIEGMSPLTLRDGTPIEEREDPERLIQDVIFETALGFPVRLAPLP